MSALQIARQLVDAGKYVDALDALSHGDEIGRHERLAADVMRADISERIGRIGQSRSMIAALLRASDLSLSQRSVCEFVLSRLDWEDGDIESSISHIQLSVELAKSAGDLERLCWSQLRLISLLDDRSGPDAASPLLSELRVNATKLADPQVTAALHITVGNLDGKRGLLQSGERHTRIGQELLAKRPNVWLESWAENSHLALLLLMGDADAAMAHARRCLVLVEQSGAPAARRTCLINLGNLFYSVGRFDEAVEYFHSAMAALPSCSEHANASLESIARTRLSQGLVGECARLLDRVDESILTPTDRRLYVYRNTQLTRTHLLARQGRMPEALAGAESLIHLAEESGDYRLRQIGLLTRAELLQQTGDVAAAMSALEVVVETLAHQSPELHAHYERILACALLDGGDSVSADLHLRRARRLYESMGSAPGLIELGRRWEETGQAVASRSPMAAPPPDSPVPLARDVLQTTAGLLRHKGRPELLARELVHLLAETDCVEEARAVSVGPGGPRLLVAASGRGGASTDPCAERRILLGSTRDRRVELELRVRRDIDAQATVNAVLMLLATVQDLESAQAEREERISLWPPDEDTETGDAIVGEQMRGVMKNARRIANTNVGVFITGESGTGKEIVARAIHRFSDRAGKPFIPFNCTAVPRDMLESHLFGHRRGSFTGADRDHPGMIGAARDGTLFLDEIGELGLDLQPKLLRFLESSEVCPVGESTPFTINVRIVAATNANVEEAVKDGRLREDLFYRLNVFRLKIPPLRERRDEIQALVRHFVTLFAGEFRKGDLHVSDEAMEHLLLCRWPGNVRQLQNEVRRMVALAETNAILTPGDLSEDVFSARLTPRASPAQHEMLVGLNEKLQPTVARIEREMIRLALRDNQSNLDAAARALGISRKGLYLKRQRLGL